MNLGPTQQETVDLVNEYEAKKAARELISAQILWLESRYPDGVGNEEYIDCLIIQPERKQTKIRVQAVLADWTLSVQIIDQRMPALEKMLFDAGVAIDYKP